jgi:hypothetical protein
MIKAPLRTLLSIGMICLFCLGSVLGEGRWSKFEKNVF